MPDITYYDEPPSPYARRVFVEVMQALERDPSTIELYANTKITNAVGQADYINNRRIIRYSPKSMSSLETVSRRGWGPYKVIAHEVGHHLWQMKQADGKWGKSNWERELAADYYAGVALARLECSSHDLEDYFNWFFDENGTEKHPDTVLRLRAIRTGWMDGGNHRQVLVTDIDKLYDIYWERMTRWWPDDHPQHPKFQRKRK